MSVLIDRTRCVLVQLAQGITSIGWQSLIDTVYTKPIHSQDIFGILNILLQVYELHMGCHCDVFIITAW